MKPVETGQRPIKNNEIFIIIPAYNEGQVVAQTVMPLIQKGYSVVVVDDGSQDDTRKRIQTLSLHYLRHPINLGQGAALQTGMSYALLQGAKILVHFDSDGQHESEDIERLVRPLLGNKTDVVLGSRFLRREDAALVPPTRRIFLRTAVFVNALLTGVWLSDAHNGFRAFTAKAAAVIQLRENGFAHASEIIQQIREKKLRWVECPVAISYNAYSLAKGQPWWNAFNIVADMLLRRMFR